MANLVENLLPENHESFDVGRDQASILVYSGTLTELLAAPKVLYAEIGSYRDFTLFLSGTAASTRLLTISYQLSDDGVTYYDPLKEADGSAATPILNAKATGTAFAWCIPLTVNAHYIKLTAALTADTLTAFVMRLFMGV